MNPQIPQIKQKPPKRVFFAAVVMVFFCTLSSADSIGFVPCYLDGSECSVAQAAISDGTVALSNLPELGESYLGAPEATSTRVVPTVLPTRIKIAAIGLDLPVQNPATRNIDALDILLQKGPARYADSAKLGGPGNMIIFAHSSHLPIVHNKMFQAFNKIPDLTAGDAITIHGEDGVDYLYSVTRVAKADASDTTIDLSPTQGTKLTLVTCDTLTGKSARYILEADFIGVVGTVQ